MRIAIAYTNPTGGPLVDADGHVAGNDAGATLVRRLLRVFPGARLIGPRAQDCEGFEVVPLTGIDPERTVVINMGVVDSTELWRTLARQTPEPHVMNFLWQAVTHWRHPVERSALALSCALFPTFANSERTAFEAREVMRQLTVAPLAERAVLAWVNLGIRLEHVQPRRRVDVPVVLYPAIYLSERKQPRLFMDVVERVHARTPIRVEMRLHESHLVSEPAMRLSQNDWAWVGPLTASRESYWEALSRTTAFLATATEESYGLEYVEALVAGAVGVFPDRPWARAILPARYPYLYTDAAQAEALLLRAVTDPARCRAELDACVGGDFQGWLRARHDDDLFEKAIAERVVEWFGA
ncbi:glycosyltransferase family 1 protein [Cellulomonas alba]|uniref:Glycosyltransferase family 1 protein n=1 Tax=Cellulomonas alba TaxID=3053467 RepID=A0ABT7SIW4_9CELL|nr:glycosyltransferase family 1 protein [Cellulomonas alba]MDM7856110.1 glycosyltransferase family 1 protein [Cellulomonas alba]